MDAEQPMQVIELRISYRYAQAHPWVVQAITGFLSSYFIEHPDFRVQRHVEELESGVHMWVCDIPPGMKVRRLLTRLRTDLPPSRVIETQLDPATGLQYVIDCPETPGPADTTPKI